MFVSKVLRAALVGAIALTAVLVSPSASAAELEVKSVKASSTLPTAEGVSYDPSNAVDHQVGTFWVEGEEAAGLGEWIQFDFAKTETVSRIEIRPGNWYSADFWKRHNRMKEVELKFQTGAPIRHEFPDKQVVQVINLEKPVSTRFVRIILKGVHNGTTFNDTCLSEVRFFGPGDSAGVVAPASGKASSVYPGYEPAEAFDGMRDTLWCEKADGDGAGEWLELTLPAEANIKGVRLIVGTGAAESAYMRNNRIAQVRVSTEGGEVSQALVDKFGVAQEVNFPAPVKGKTVKITVEKVIRGIEFNDTCLAEVEILTAE